VNGLDYSGFSSANWIVGGKQRRFEVVRVENLAAIQNGGAASEANRQLSDNLNVERTVRPG
jgi:hypothetical protein